MSIGFSIASAHAFPSLPGFNASAIRSASRALAQARAKARGHSASTHLAPNTQLGHERNPEPDDPLAGTCEGGMHRHR